MILLTKLPDAIDLRRYQAVEAVLYDLHSLPSNYRSSSYTCIRDKAHSYKCGSIMFGASKKQLDDWSLSSPRPEIPFHNTTLHDIYAKVRRVSSPVWLDSERSGQLFPPP
ncbi:hypothetical protein C7974DRAFT_388567 [Boeremia exigua]|uniref:uncharacterized protein n=1 Tax=Boeremia exigua TaxID=749465 RepID=UPI001E8CFF57|nr:uncharacterized protein C7974DRAFT_388567 [Boeremia exigua]KAH6639467.1 hypothetical protein C7974DRAFT_388567 [Boeremia exigua]